MEEAEDLEEGRGSKRGTNGCEVEVWSMSVKEERIVGDERRKEKERQKVIYRGRVGLDRRDEVRIGEGAQPDLGVRCPNQASSQRSHAGLSGKRHFAGKAGRLPRWSHQCD